MPDQEDPQFEELQRDLENQIKELEGLNSQQGAPFIERPDALDIGENALCWMDGTRMCNADCVAYNVEDVDPETGNALQGPNKCLPLLYMGQQGAAALSTLLVNRKRINQIQDQQRAQQLDPKPPNPFGT